MNRRGFIQISSVALLPILLGVFPRSSYKNLEYTIKVNSNRKFGHKLRNSQIASPIKRIETDYIIVGGGIAGVSAAASLKGLNFLLFEAGDKLGGSSSFDHWKGTQFAVGAHYELAYPKNFGKEVIDLLVQKQVIEFNSQSDLYEFIDKKYVINADNIEQCYIQGRVIADIMDEVDGVEALQNFLSVFENEMPLPTRLIDKKYAYLNAIDFHTFLENKLSLSEELIERISYQMIDDWGSKINNISALAGIHYYTCRPYQSKYVELFSPPQGNAYFIEKLVADIDNFESLRTSSLVRSINETADGVEVEVIDEKNKLQLIKAKGLIYAGQKHSLKYILKNYKNNLPEVEYAPWVTINFICRKGINFEKWQNDVLTPELEFLGFVNSGKQHSRSQDYDVFTAYYCFNSEQRNLLVEIEKNPKIIIESTIELVKNATKIDFGKFLEHVNINLLGHAMPIPKPGYLSLDDVPKFSDRIIFAGVDTGRLPLFFEACDSGIQAANELKKIIV